MIGGAELSNLDMPSLECWQYNFQLQEYNDHLFLLLTKLL